MKKSTAGKIQPIKKIPCPDSFEIPKSKMKFKPDKELLNFATWFSENYKKLPVGEYHSKKYRISYLNKIKETIYETESIAKIHNETGVMKFNKKNCKSKHITPDCIFFLILWLNAMRLVKNRLIADFMTLEYYLKLKKSKKEICLGFLQIMKGNPSYLEYNLKRYKAIEEFIDNFEAKQKSKK